MHHVEHLRWIAQQARKWQLKPGEMGNVTTTAQVQRDGKWITAPARTNVGRYKASAYVCGWDGERKRLSAYAPRKGEAEARLADKVRLMLGGGDGALSATSSLRAAGEAWLAEVDRSDKAERTKTLYRATWDRYVVGEGSPVKSLTVAQVNTVPRLRAFLEQVADTYGDGAAKTTRTVVKSVLGMLVNDGVIALSAMPQVPHVKAKTVKRAERDHTRALTDEDREALRTYVANMAAEPLQHAGSRSMWRACQTLVLVMLGTGARITEARMLRWEDVDLHGGTVHLRGSKSKTADRNVTLPGFLMDHLTTWGHEVGEDGYVIPAPRQSDPERSWEQSAAAKAVRAALDGAGLTWAVPHTLRRTVATRLHDAGVPLRDIADHLGHADPSMTASVYLGRDAYRRRDDVAAALD